MQVTIIGGGISGLTAAYYLEQQEGINITLLEKSDRIGGRIKTDEVDGFLLDHGFQVFLTAYPEARAILDYEALDLRMFMTGAVILEPDNHFDVITDPSRELAYMFKTIFSSKTTWSDKFKTLSLKKALKRKDYAPIFVETEKTTKEYLSERFSEKYIQSFFAPFFKGIFLEKNLDTSSRMFEFVFKMFSEGFAAIPAKGMREIPKQLASKLKKTDIRLESDVISIENDHCTLSNNETIASDVILIATEGNGLISKYRTATKTSYNSNTTMYFASANPPTDLPAILLQPDPEKFINNICVMSHVSPKYSDNKEMHLIAVSLVGDHSKDGHLLSKIEAELVELFGQETNEWKHIKTYHIPYSLPDQQSVVNYLKPEEFKIRDGLYCCGDHLFNGSINAAMKSGRLAAKSILNTFASQEAVVG